MSSHSYVYDSDGEKTVTSTATGIGDADGILQNNIITVAVYDKHGNILSQTDGNGNITQYILDGMNVVAELNSQGNRHTNKECYEK